MLFERKVNSVGMCFHLAEAIKIDDNLQYSYIGEVLLKEFGRCYPYEEYTCYWGISDDDRATILFLCHQMCIRP